MTLRCGWAGSGRWKPSKSNNTFSNSRSRDRSSGRDRSRGRNRSRSNSRSRDRSSGRDRSRSRSRGNELLLELAAVLATIPSVSL